MTTATETKTKTRKRKTPPPEAEIAPPPAPEAERERIAALRAEGVYTTEDLPLFAVVRYPRNPRGVVRADDPSVLELMESLREHGQTTALLVRPLADGYQVLGGERRLVAMLALGWSSGRATVRGDAEHDEALAYELALIDNAQREDVHPLDEADAIVALMQERKITPEGVAAKLAKSVSHVHGRLRLASLGKEARELFRPGLLTLRAAAAVARLDERSQQDVLREALRLDGLDVVDGEPIATRSVLRAIQDRTHRLRDAKFPLDVAPPAAVKAPACATCHKATDAQTALFADVVEGENRCTDGACWGRKNAWWFAELSAAAKAEKAAGAKVQKSPKDTSTTYGGKLWIDGRYFGRDLAAVDDLAYGAGGRWERLKIGKHDATWEQAHEKAFGGPIPRAELVITVDDTGAPRELASKAVVDRIRSAFRKPDPKAKLSAAEKARRAREREERAARKVDTQARREAHARALEVAKDFDWHADPVVALRALTLLSLERLWAQEALTALGVPRAGGGKGAGDEMVEHLEGLEDEQLVRVLMTALLERSRSDGVPDTALRQRGLALIGVDQAAIRNEIMAAKARPKKRAGAKTIAATEGKRGRAT